MPYRDKYNVSWNIQPDALQVEFQQIRLGKNLFEHYRNAMSLIKPTDDNHRWSDLVLKSFIDNDITVVMGCKDSSKSMTFAKICVVDYLCFPNETLWMVSTTEGRGSELRIWGYIKEFFNAARERFVVAGNPIDYMKTITTDDIDDEKQFARSLRNGIIVIPCRNSGVSGLGAFIGMKAPRLRHLGDEISAMGDNFLKAYSNWDGKENFKGLMTGNFMQTDDPLGVASEPKDGWDSWVDNGKTQEWDGRFFNAHVIALDGRDSPNFDFTNSTGKLRYPYLISQKGLDNLKNTYGENSVDYWTFGVGKPCKNMDIWRVITRDFCIKNKATEDVVWDGSNELIKGYALDPAYGGGDRCVGRPFEIGKNISGKQILNLGKPEIIPVDANSIEEPEEQIARNVCKRLKDLEIDPSKCFYDSFGKGTLGASFAKIIGFEVPVPINSGETATDRPVRFDMFVEEKGNKRLKKCSEHYIKFVTEMWFSVREIVDCQQLRNLDVETIREGQARKFNRDNPSYKIELETKDDFKKRFGKSPDLFDCLSIACEGARRLGFQIQNIPSRQNSNKPNQFKKLSEEHSKLIKSRELQAA